MADRNRRFALGTIALPFFLLVTSGLARAATIVVNTLNGGSETVPGPCSLTDAVAAANAGGTVNNCVAGSGANTITFSVTGTINQVATLEVTTASPLAINGPSGGITLSGPVASIIVSGNLGTTITLTNLTLTNSSTATFSKGISLTIENCTFFNNEGTAGVGVFAVAGTVTITNSTFVDNVATGEGGAINNISGATFLLTNDTFVGNHASIGGAVYTGTGITDIKGTIFTDSTGGNCGGSAVTDVGHNISDDNSCAFTVAPSGTSVNNSTTLNLDPAGLQNNGGPTKTIAPEGNSEAVDFIPVGKCTDQSPTPMKLTTDQRGFPRPDPGDLGFCDAGAFELQTPPVFVFAPNTERLQIARSTTPNSDKLNLAFTFTENGFPVCDAGDDAFNGFNVYLATGSCASLNFGGPVLFLDGWVVHTVNHQSYGTLFFDGGGTLSARMVELSKPPAPACGQWSVNLELAGFDSAFLGNGPFALGLKNPDGDEGCFEITNAIVGSQIPTPSH